MLDGQTQADIAREVLAGIEQSDSRYAPLNDEMKSWWSTCEKSFADAPEGAVIEIPYSQGEEPSKESLSLTSGLIRDMIAEHRAREAIVRPDNSQK